MQKKGQIALYIVIAIVMLGAFGYGFYYLIHGQDGSDSGASFIFGKQSLDASGILVQNYVQNCLEQRTREGIDLYGIKLNSMLLIKNYIEMRLESCIDFGYLEKNGVRIEKGQANAQVNLTEQAIRVILKYPITVNTTNGISNLERFEYSLKRERTAAVDPHTNIINHETRMVTEDGDAEFVIAAGTRVYNFEGTQIDEISVKVVDKNIGGLSNKIVIGQIVYEGTPSGTFFEPAINVNLDVNYADVPKYVNFKDLKCAYYDEAADIWRTYQTTEVVDNGATEKTYSVKCLVNHFSLMAVLQCGSQENIYEISLDPFFNNPIQVMNGKVDITGDPTIWMTNAQVKGGEETDRGIHLIPEKMAQAGCVDKFENAAVTGTPDVVSQTFISGGTILDIKTIDILLSKTDYYSGGPAGFPLSQAERLTFPRKPWTDNGNKYCEQSLLQDWDNDDNPKFVPEVVPFYQYYGKNFLASGQPWVLMKEFTDFKDSYGGFFSIYMRDKTPAEVFDRFEASCRESCKKVATDADTPYFYGIKANNRISGDGINDYLPAIRCKLKIMAKGNNGWSQLLLSGWDSLFNGGMEYTINEESLSSPECIVADTKDTEFPFDNRLKTNLYFGNNANQGKGTMEYPPQDTDMAFFATPKTYGYAKTNQFVPATINVADYSEAEMKKLENIGLGGYGEYQFEMRISGGSCVQNNGNIPDRVELNVSSLDGSRNDPLSVSHSPVIWNVIEGSCSDTCIWTLNDLLVVLPGFNDAPYSSEKAGNIGNIIGGMNYVRSYVSNKAVDETPDPVFYVGGKITFTGIGLILEDKCGTTVAQRLDYLFYKPDPLASVQKMETGSTNVKGREDNCLYTYSRFNENDVSWKIESTRLCSGADDPVVDFSDPLFRAYVSGSDCGDHCLPYCTCMAYTDEIFKIADGLSDEEKAYQLCIHYNCNTGDSACEQNCDLTCGKYYKRFDVLSPNGGAKVAEDIFSCPDIIDYDRDIGCKCGSGNLGSGGVNDGSPNTMYCCSAKFIDELPNEGLGICRNGNTVEKWCESNSGVLNCGNCIDSSSPPTVEGTIVWAPVYNGECS